MRVQAVESLVCVGKVAEHWGGHVHPFMRKRVCVCVFTYNYTGSFIVEG